jgi:hypothetical protein
MVDAIAFQQRCHFDWPEVVAFNLQASKRAAFKAALSHVFPDP